MNFVAWMNGRTGRWLRAIAGLALIIIGTFTGGAGGVVLGLIGLVVMVVGAAGVCLIAPLLHASPRTR